MKKYIAWVLVFALCLVGFVNDVAAYAEDESIPFDPTLTNLADQTSSTWYSSSSTRALLTVLLGLDLATSLDTFDTDCIFNPSYVAEVEQDGITILCVFFTEGDEAGYYIFYSPLAGIAYYDRKDLDSDSLEWTIDLFSDSYYENELEEILSVAKELVEALGSE